MNTLIWVAIVAAAYFIGRLRLENKILEWVKGKTAKKPQNHDQP